MGVRRVIFDGFWGSRRTPENPRKMPKKVVTFWVRRCESGRGWGGSAHYPDPTAQSVRSWTRVLGPPSSTLRAPSDRPPRPARGASRLAQTARGASRPDRGPHRDGGAVALAGRLGWVRLAALAAPHLAPPGAPPPPSTSPPPPSPPIVGSCGRLSNAVATRFARGPPLAPQAGCVPARAEPKGSQADGQGTCTHPRSCGPTSPGGLLRDLQSGGRHSPPPPGPATPLLGWPRSPLAGPSCDTRMSGSGRRGSPLRVSHRPDPWQTSGLGGADKVNLGGGSGGPPGGPGAESGGPRGGPGPGGRRGAPAPPARARPRARGGPPGGPREGVPGGSKSGVLARTRCTPSTPQNGRFWRFWAPQGVLGVWPWDPPETPQTPHIGPYIRIE